MLETYVRVDGFDHARLGESVAALTVFVGNRCYMRLFDGHCAALVVDLPTGRFVCSVYATRPGVCRDLQRASPECAGELYVKAERPIQLLRGEPTALGALPLVIVK
jgi:hypothetical protein